MSASRRITAAQLISNASKADVKVAQPQGEGELATTEKIGSGWILAVLNGAFEVMINHMRKPSILDRIVSAHFSCMHLCCGYTQLLSLTSFAFNFHSTRSTSGDSY